MGRLTRPLHVPYSFGLPYSYTTPTGTRPMSSGQVGQSGWWLLQWLGWLDLLPYYLAAVHQGRRIFWGIFRTNSTIEIDPNRDSIPIFRSLEHRFTTSRELPSSARLRPLRGFPVGLRKLILLAVYSSDHHMWGTKLKLVSASIISIQNITPSMARAGQFSWKRTKNSLKVELRNAFTLMLFAKLLIVATCIWLQTIGSAPGKSFMTRRDTSTSLGRVNFA